MIPGFLFSLGRIAEILTLIPTVGMLSWFVHGYTESNQLTPNAILVLFIVSVLALAWAVGTLILYARAKNSGMFVAVVDLLFVGAFIAGVYYLRGIADADCADWSDGSLYVDLGVFGYYGRNSDEPWGLNVDKNCAMLKASFAFGIMNIIFFFITFLFALLVGRHHRNKETVVVRRGSSRRHHHSSRSYASSPRRSHHSHRSRRSYYV